MTPFQDTVSIEKNVGKASVTKAIKILEKEGFIKRVADEQDKRNINCIVLLRANLLLRALVITQLSHLDKYALSISGSACIHVNILLDFKKT